jgi:hypothetical protein
MLAGCLFSFCVRLSSVYEQMVEKRLIVPSPEIVPPSVPMDYDWARVRKHFYYTSLSRQQLHFLKSRSDFVKFNAK